MNGDHPRRTVRQKLRLIATVCCWIMLSAWVIGQVFRDRFWLTGVCFYNPSPVVMLVFIAMGLSRIYRKLYRSALLSFAIAMVPGLFVVAIENHFDDRSVPIADNPNRIRLVHWNMAYGEMGWPETRDKLLSYNADCYVISECARAFSASEFPGYKTRRRGEIAMAVRKYLEDDATPYERDGGEIQYFRWDSKWGNLRLFICDYPSDIFVHRDPHLQALRMKIEEMKPDIVVGDFNAPRRSSALDPLPGGYRHAYETVGSGWSYTWPTPIPVYAIDQCIFGPRITPYEYRIHSTLLSDHRIQVFDFTFDEKAP